jgi:hypothetical protein
MPPQPNTPNNTEIDQALKEFETKSNQEQPVQATTTPQSPKTPNHEVEGVSFDTDKELQSYGAIKYYRETVEPKMVKAVIKYSGGVIKDQRQAEYSLFALVCIIIIISIIIIYHSTAVSPAKPTALPPDYDFYHNQTK